MDPNSTQARRPRTSEDFSRFCQIVLEYTKYDERPRQEELRQTASSPMDSAGSINSESTSSSKQDEMTSSSDDDNDRDSDSVDSDSYNLVTCYCGKPFAGRPMIECSICLTWVHLTCAKVKRNNIPEVFSCNKCKNKQTSVITDSNTQNHRARKKVSL